MARSGGVVASAVIVLIGSASSILLGVLMLLVGIFVPHSHLDLQTSSTLDRIMILESIVPFAFGGWGIATGVGLTRTRAWARISVIVFSIFLLLVTIPATLAIAIIPLPIPADPQLPENFMTFLRVSMVTFYAVLAAPGLFWLIFFNRKNVKAEFQGQSYREFPPAAVPAFSDASAGVAFAVPPPVRSARPVSITVIGWFLLIGSAVAPLSIWFTGTLFPGGRLPMFFFGFLFYGRREYLILGLWVGVQAVAAVAMLRLKNWGRLTTIGMQFLSMVNAVLIFVVPANRLKLQELMQEMYASMAARTHQPVPMYYPWWFGLVTTLPIFLVVLWFLLKSKDAFEVAAREKSAGAS